MTPRRVFGVAVWLVAAVVIAALVIAVMRGGNRSHAEQCRLDGGTVTKEYERKGRSWITEYECIRDGEEINEWKVSGRR